MHRRTIVSSTRNYKEYKWKFELQYYDEPDTTGKYLIRLISMHPEKLFRYQLDTNTNIIGYMQDIIIKETSKIKPAYKFENICHAHFGFTEIKLIANFSA